MIISGKPVMCQKIYILCIQRQVNDKQRIMDDDDDDDDVSGMVN